MTYVPTQDNRQDHDFFACVPILILLAEEVSASRRSREELRFQESGEGERRSAMMV